MLRFTQAKVVRSWCAAAHHKAWGRAKAEGCLCRLTTHRLRHALKEWRSEATYKREARSMLKVCKTGCLGSKTAEQSFPRMLCTSACSMLTSLLCPL